MRAAFARGITKIRTARHATRKRKSWTRIFRLVKKRRRNKEGAMRREKKRRVTRVRLRPQREVLRDVMLSANECGAWLTLAELSAMTRYPAASISAQLRHLKKPRFGNYELEKRMRDAADFYSGNAHGA